MATTQYIGARYVPILADPVEWSSAKTYEPLTIVTHEGNSYTSRQFVPIGIDISNGEFWALTGNYNAQIEQYRRETAQAVENSREYTDAAVNQVDEWLTDAQDKYGAKPFAFDTVEIMQHNYELLYEGAICHTNGFRTIGDGGAAWYIITDTGLANNMDVFACGNLFASLVNVESFVMPECFGAYGDGVTDDYRYLQYAIDYGFAHNKRVVLTKKYFTTQTINVYGVSSTAVKFGTFIEGQVDAEIITNNNINILTLTPHDDATRAYGIKIKNIMLNGNNSAISGIYADTGCANSVFEDIIIKYCTNGMYIKGNCYLNTFNSIRTYHTTDYGILFTNGNNTSNVFTKCYVDTSKNAYKLNGQYCTMISCCADVITENVFELSSFKGALIGCGSEAHTAICMFKINQNVILNITGGFYYALDAEDAYYFDIAAGSNIQVNSVLLNYTTNENTPNSMAKLAYQSKLTLRNVVIYQPFAKEDSLNPNAALVVNTGISTVSLTVTLDENNEATIPNISASTYAILDIYTTRSGWTLLWYRISASTYKIKICGQNEYFPNISNKEFPLNITLLKKNSV